jgi:hypothetical protein
MVCSPFAPFLFDLSSFLFVWVVGMPYTPKPDKSSVTRSLSEGSVNSGLNVAYFVPSMRAESSEPWRLLPATTSCVSRYMALIGEFSGKLQLEGGETGDISGAQSIYATSGFL